jgi:hypothetical protein
VGLKAFSGKLNTFYGAGRGDHARRHALRRAPRAAHHHRRRAGQDPLRDQYNALLYVAAEYGDGTFRHHYLDPATTTRARRGSRSRRTRRTPSSCPPCRTAFATSVTAGGGGASAAASRRGRRARQHGGRRRAHVDVPHLRMTDANCPHTKQVAKQAQKIYAVGSTRPRCATARRATRATGPRRRRRLPPGGLYARGSDQVTSINIYGNRARSRSSSPTTRSCGRRIRTRRTWALTSNIEGVGTIYHRAAGPVSNDLFFLAQSRLPLALDAGDHEQRAGRDVGSAIDKLIQADISRPTTRSRSTTRSSASSGRSTARPCGCTASAAPRSSARGRMDLPLQRRRRLRAEPGAVRAHRQRRLQGHRRRLQGRRQLDPAGRRAMYYQDGKRPA